VVILQAPQQLHVDVRAPGDTMTVFHPPRDITPVETVIRWFLSVPQWVQLTGAALAMIVAIGAAVLVWRNARSIRAWAHERHLRTPLFWKAVIGAAAVSVLLGMAGGSAAFFFYSQNNNQFCLSCHTLHDEVYQRFQQSKHHRVANLRCHDCHDEPLVAEMTQVAKWMLLRPAEVGPHAPVPRAVCANCHIQRDADSTWKRIIATAGHTVHLETDTAKKLSVECLTCHGVTAHRFVPVAQTCAQSGCHKNTSIQLGKMAGQTALHCVTCHQFTAPVADTASMNVAFATLVPGERNCLGCHEMRKVIERFVPANDPHKGECGACHNPHTQTTPAAAFKSCTNSGCHARPDTLTPFHRGTHAVALANCGTCHQEHTWKVRGTDCLDCHQNIYKTPPKPAFRPPRRVSMVGITHAVSRLVLGDVGNGFLLAARWVLETRASLLLPQAAAERDTIPFSHAVHRGLTCTACHSAAGPSHGTVMLRSMRDCQQCHHDATVRKLGGGADACLHCHQREALPARTLAVTVRTSTSTRPLTRDLPFAHATHANVSCAHCHTTPVTLAAPVECGSCHANHHEAARDCRTCHAAYDAHIGQQVHTGCGGSGCHTDRATLALTSARNVCLSCHTKQVDHKPGRDCGTCHRVHWTARASAPVGERGQL
jgi:hypothetical protein